VKPLPPGVPPASSPTWHSRRSRDSLGYLRVRSLANPAWRRNLPWLVTLLRRETPPTADELRPLYEAAVAAAARYPRTRTGAIDRDASWDELLTCIDDILVRRQRYHLDAVRTAGVSGKDVPPEGAPS
jgi:hypothetical protein